jgi:hypothetical protein
MPEAILTPRATLKWPSRHKHRVYCDIEEALLNIDGDENSNSHGGRHTGRGVRLTVRQALLSWVRTVENEDSSFLARLLGVALAFA